MQRMLVLQQLLLVVQIDLMPQEGISSIVPHLDMPPSFEALRKARRKFWIS